MSDTNNMKARNIKHCSRCVEDHAAVEMRELKRPFAPPEANGIEWTHWAPCPTNGEPILFIVTEGGSSDVMPGTPVGRN